MIALNLIVFPQSIKIPVIVDLFVFPLFIFIISFGVCGFSSLLPALLVLIFSTKSSIHATEPTFCLQVLARDPFLQCPSSRLMCRRLSVSVRVFCFLFASLLSSSLPLVTLIFLIYFPQLPVQKLDFFNLYTFNLYCFCYCASFQHTYSINSKPDL